MSRKRKRKRRWLWALLGTAAVLVAAGFFAANLAINTFLDMMLGDSKGGLALEELLTQDAVEAGVETTVPDEAVRTDSGGLPASDRIERGGGLRDSAEVKDQSETQPGGGQTAQNPPSPSSSAEATPSGGQVPSGQPHAASSGEPVAGNGLTEANDGSELAYSPEISVEKAEKVQEEITLREKAKVTEVVLRNFSADDLRLFMQLAQGGLTVEEKKEAKKIFLEKLSPEEYNALITIAAKYGLSRGQTYEESTKPE